MIYLYIKQHNKTGLKYFGKTINDPYKYNGSGKYWIGHLNKHGYEITTLQVFEFECQQKCTEFALKFSRDNMISSSDDWANLKEENGLDGNPPGFGGSKKGRIISEEHKQKLSIAASGERNYMFGKRGPDSPNFNRVVSKETGKKISDALKGNSFSEEHKQKLRKPKSKVICPHCRKEGAGSNMKRWHFDNCKVK